MFLVILEEDNYQTKIILESVFLALFFLELIFDFIIKSNDHQLMSNRFKGVQIFKLILLILMLADIIIFATTAHLQIRPIRPFRILRICNYLKI